MAELSFVDFRKFANAKLNILKEATSSQYAEYVMKNFGKLHESVTDEDLYNIARYNELDKENTNILRNAIYDDGLYDYFIYDDRTCIGVNKEGKIIYIGDYIASNLNGGSVSESNDRIKQTIKDLEAEAKMLEKEANNAPKGKLTGFSKYEDKMNHARRLREKARQLKARL